MNWPTIIVASLVAAALVLIAVNSYRNKKKGKSSCSCGCGGCAMRESCHSQAPKAKQK